MHKYHNPKSIMANASYTHGVEAVGPLRWLAIAGQVGRDTDSSIPDGIEAQAEVAWRNLADVLKEAGMDMTDLFDVTVYLVNRDDNVGFDKARMKWLGPVARPACTKIYVSGLANPKLLCEVQALAARPVK
jgi:2-iminobutanoate/2-iminopropanoate deaminase